MLNAYALVNSQAVYEGQRRPAPPTSAVFILTRNGFAGQQRYSGRDLVGRHLIDLDGNAKADPCRLGSRYRACRTGPSTAAVRGANPLCGGQPQPRPIWRMAGT